MHMNTITVCTPSCTGDICVVVASLRVDQVERKGGNVSNTTSTAALTTGMLDLYANTNNYNNLCVCSPISQGHVYKHN